MYESRTNEGKSALMQEYNRLKNLVADGSLLEGEVN
jgi:hypothetical protein